MAAKRLLVVVAHPDDAEITSAGLAALCARRGWTVRFVTATNGNAGHQSMRPGPLAARRKIEAARAAGLIGASSGTLGEPDGGLFVTPRTTDKTIAEIRRFDPDVLISHRTCDYHRDHRATAQLVLDASYMLMVPLSCPAVRSMARMPVILYHHDHFSEGPAFRADLVFDIGPAMAVRTQMMLAHASQFREWLPWVGGRKDVSLKRPLPVDAALRRDLERRPAAIARQYARQLRRKYRRTVAAAEAFQVCEYGRRPSAAELSALLPF